MDIGCGQGGGSTEGVAKRVWPRGWVMRGGGEWVVHSSVTLWQGSSQKVAMCRGSSLEVGKRTGSLEGGAMVEDSSEGVVMVAGSSGAG